MAIKSAWMVISAALFATLLVAPCHAQPASSPSSSSTSAPTVERGRYLVLVGHCNNCHTAGYAAKEGEVPETQWLMGNPVGWRSKAGTSYAHNLRITVQSMSEDAWLQLARTAKWRAPMPWWSMRHKTDDDLRAVYRYIRSLTPVGKPAPTFLPPDQVPPRPYQQLPDMS